MHPQLDLLSELWDIWFVDKTLKSLFLVACLQGFALPAWAQIDVTEASTPRDRVVEFITGTPTVPRLRGLAAPALKSEVKSEVKPKALLTDLVGGTPDKKLAADETSSDIATRAVALPKAAKAVAEDISIAPFYLSAKDYLQARGHGVSKQLHLTYTLKPIEMKVGIDAKPKVLDLIIGPDFAAVSKGDRTRIFDFKMNRRLSIRSKNTEPIFDNSSLYAVALRNVDTVKKVTKNGTLEAISTGDKTTIDTFWMESSLGFSMRSEVDGLSVKRVGPKIKASYKAKTPFEATLDGPKLPGRDHMRSLFVYLHHDAAIHPSILYEMGRFNKVPSTMTILSYSPKSQNGLKTIWTLTDHKATTAKFPLSDTASNALEVGQISPLAFVISEAANQRALQGRQSEDSLRQDVFNKTQSGDNMAAWMQAKTLAYRLGGCEQDPALLCEDIAELETGARAKTPLSDLIKALDKIESPSSRVAGFETLVPYIDEGAAPGFLVKAAGRARARLKRSDLKSEAAKALAADRLLEEALAKNPYDPEIYRLLAQVYASQGRFAESWDVQDALRLMDDVPEALTDPINRVEAVLLEQAPGYFFSKTP